MKFNIFSKFREKSKYFKITAVIAAVVIIVLGICYKKFCLKNVPAQSITLQQEEIYLETNMVYNLTPSLIPYNTTPENICYKISNEDIIKIEDSRIIPKTIGIAYIYCYDKTSNVKSKSLKVNVVKSIAKLIPKTNGDNEDEQVLEKSDSPRFVYFTYGGTKYHLETCSYLGKNPQKTTINNAINNDFTPCQRCKPYVDTE